MRSGKLEVVFEEATIDKIFADLNQNQLPGAAVGIAIQGKPVYRKGFGLANVELPVVLCPSIRMRLGSTSKHIAAFAYMLLCEQGKAGLDDPIRKYLPELHQASHAATMRQLMTNTSGLRDVYDIRGQFSGTAGTFTTRTDFLDLYKRFDDVNAPPDTVWIYNNGGWLLLALAIERITGDSFEEAMRKLVFEPLGMVDTLVRPADTDFVPNSAASHPTNTKGKLEKLYWNRETLAEGGVVSTVNDMLKWVTHMDAPTVGTATTWSAMKTPHVLRNGTTTGYGFGLFTSIHRGIEVIQHSGGGIGCNAQMLKVPAAGLDIVIMMNSSRLNTPYVNAILNACLPDLLPLRTPTPGTASGVYRSPTTGLLIQLFARNEHQMLSTDGMDQQYEREDDGLLRPGFEALQIQRTAKLIGDPTQPSSILFSDFGNVDELVRLQPPRSTDIQRACGRYRSESTDSEVCISGTSDGPRMTCTGRFGSTDSSLECLADDIWRTRTLRQVGPPSAILSFDPDGNGLHFSNFQTRRLPFKRC